MLFGGDLVQLQRFAFGDLRQRAFGLVIILGLFVAALLINLKTRRRPSSYSLSTIEREYF